jgi:hypothetical protein
LIASLLLIEFLGVSARDLLRFLPMPHPLLILLFLLFLQGVIIAEEIERDVAECAFACRFLLLDICIFFKELALVA